jgi:hypothetical protein
MRRSVVLLGMATILLLSYLSGDTAKAQVRRDLKALDVCQAVPGEAVAKAVGGQFAEARPFAAKDSTLARCTYQVTLPGAGSGARKAYVVWVYPAADFESLRKFTAGRISEVPGLGDGAHAFQDSGDGRFKIRVLKRGDVTIEATADTADAARKVAETALACFSKAK